MKGVIWTGRGGAELSLEPSERIVAAGTCEAVRAAARLLCGEAVRFATMDDRAARDVRALCDAEVFAHLEDVSSSRRARIA